MGLLRDLQGRQLSWLELAISIVLISLIFLFVSERVGRIAARVEAQRVRTSVTRMTSNLQMTVASRLMNGATSDLGELEGQNPMSLGTDTIEGIDIGSNAERLVLTGRSYLGELANPDLTEIPAGKWFFDSGERVLVYMVQASDYFKSDLTGPSRIRYRLTLDYQDQDGNQRYDRGIDTLRGVVLQAVEPFMWNVR